jgi:hypothetical protein
MIAATEILTPCECPIAGYCPRHKCEKVPHWHWLCKTQPDYFDAWERGEGPGQIQAGDGLGPGRRLGLGDVVAWAIRRATLGRLRICEPCSRRKAWLNRHFPIWPLPRPRPWPKK